MEPANFYGLRKSKAVVLPPINPSLSDAEDSNSEAEIFADNSDDDPDYYPEVSSRKGLVIEPDEDSEDNSKPEEDVQDEEKGEHSTSVSAKKKTRILKSSESG